MPWLQESFMFSWKINDPFPVPITDQCETIRIEWSRQSATGPDPFGPYTLAVYTSNYHSPFIVDAGEGPAFDFTVPFAPGTRYMICMYDTNGRTGGCQDVYTVYAASPTPICKNLTAPAQVLGIEQTTNPYGWAPVCSDLTYTIVNGTAPFKLTIASALRPPYNTTIDSLGEFSWKVAVDRATPFFVSVQDASGISWTNGVLHAGKSDDTSCLAHGATKKGIYAGVVAGTGVGGFVLGALLACLAAYLFIHRRPSRSETSESDGKIDLGPPVTVTTYPTPFELNPGHREPFQIAPAASAFASPRSHTETDVDDQFSTVAGSDPGGRVTSSIFIMHHDGGAAPVTLLGPGGQRLPVQELPPSYVGGDGLADLNRGPSIGATSISRESEGRPMSSALSDISSHTGGTGRNVRGNAARKGGR